MYSHEVPRTTVHSDDNNSCTMRIAGSPAARARLSSLRASSCARRLRPQGASSWIDRKGKVVGHAMGLGISHAIEELVVAMLGCHMDDIPSVWDAGGHEQDGTVGAAESRLCGLEVSHDGGFSIRVAAKDTAEKIVRSPILGSRFRLWRLHHVISSRRCRLSVRQHGLPARFVQTCVTGHLGCRLSSGMLVATT